MVQKKQNKTKKQKNKQKFGISKLIVQSSQN